jgi:hypothetical protein
MDIGEPHEIPTTRKRLPSMQELGAFDDAPAAAPPRPARAIGPLVDEAAPLRARQDTAPAGPPAERPPGAGAVREPAASAAAATATAAAVMPPVASPNAPPRSTTGTVAQPPAREATDTLPASGFGPLASLTPEQWKAAMAKADPAVRRKLMRLFAGGEAVQQLGGEAEGAAHRHLVMKRAAPPAASRRLPGAAAAATPAAAHRPSSPAAAGPAASVGRAPGAPARLSPRTPGRADAPLMQIDEHTELLDAAPPPPTAAGRKAEMQAQLDAALQREAAPRAESAGAAHKVLFPAYDPQQHGESLHSVASRRRDAPVEGHFPAPRQPFRAHYRHPDGRPMSAEENKAEEVLQAQRCEETLSVLARDGVNGLLLSPRDLDAAVANGLLTAETAGTLWKTWAALRPVIHVIEDEPEPEPTADAAAGSAEAPEADDLGAATAAAESPAVSAPAPEAPTAPPPRRQDAADRRPDPTPARPDLARDAPTAAVADATKTPASPPVAATSTRAAPPVREAPVLATPVSEAAMASPRRPDPARPAETPPTVTSPTSAAPAAAASPRPTIGPASTAAATPPTRADPAPRRIGRLGRPLRLMALAFIAFCVLSTSARLASAAWLRWGHLISPG